MSILIEPVKTILEKSAEAASEMISKHTGRSEKIEIIETQFDMELKLELKFNGTVLFKSSYTLTSPDLSELFDARTVLYGTLLTEFVAVFAITAEKTLSDVKSH